MKGVFDFPVAPDQSEKAFGRGLLPREACDSVDDLGAKVLSLKIRHMAFDPKDLLVMGERKVGKGGQLRADGNGPPFNTAVSLVDRVSPVLRGEKPPMGGFRYPPSWSAGFL